MERNKAKKRIECLRKFINDWNYKYFVLNKTDISESARDKVKQELEALEAEFPDFISPDSPTQRVGSALSGKFKKVRHMTRKESLSDIFDFGKLKEWENRMKRILPENTELEYICELKIDGLNITLLYKNGKLLRAATRGNGIEGENVTHTVKTIESIPISLRPFFAKISNSKPNLMEISGEVYMPKKAFKKLNKRTNQEKASNARNAAAGSVRQLNPKIAAERDLRIFVYLLDEPSRKNFNIKTQSQLLGFFKDLGFPVEPHFQYCKNLEEVKKFILYWDKKRASLPYDTDGVVVKVNSFANHKELGSTAKAPRWAIAFKYAGQEAVTKILDIKLQVGRTGAITPVAIMKPVKVSGSIISRATLHNEDEIIKKDIRIGDSVIIRKAGDVIPEILCPIKKLRTGKETVFKMRKTCPMCGTILVKPKNESIWRCQNKSCFASHKEKIEHFVSRSAFDIDGLGTKIIGQLMEKNIITDSADIFMLRKNDLNSLDFFKDKKINNLLASIEKSKNIFLSKFIFALGIRYIGSETAEIIAKKCRIKNWKCRIKVKEKKEQLDLFGKEKPEEYIFNACSVEDFLIAITNWKLEELEKLDGVGKKVAESIYIWFRDKKNLKLIDKLNRTGIRLLLEKQEKDAEQIFIGQSFVITGELKNMTRDEAKKQIKRRGGRVSSSVSKKTDGLILGDNPGSKLARAKDLGIKIMRENEFIKKLK